MKFYDIDITDWISAASGMVMALFAIYAAFRVNNIFREKEDEKVHSEMTSFWEITDDMLSDFIMYEWLFPFRLEEPVNEWNNNESVKNKVNDFLGFSSRQGEKLKAYHKKIHDFERNLLRSGWRIHKKSKSDFLELYNTTLYLHNAFGEYNCLTAKLFNIEMQFISPSMFFRYEDMEWNERFEAIDKNLFRQIESIRSLVEKMKGNIESLELFVSKNKLIARQ